MVMLDASELGSALLGLTVPATAPGNNIVVSFNRVEVEIGGEVLADDEVLSIHVEYGWDKATSEAQIVLRSKLATGTYHSDVQIAVNGILRFTGILTNFDYANWPRSVGIQAKSRLVLAEDYLNQDGDTEPDEGQPGLALDVLLGVDTGGTLQQIVIAVLDICGVDTSNAGNWADPPHVYGLVAPEEFTWRMGESGLAFLHRLFEASAGYRLFSSGDGELWLAQIVGRPSNVWDIWLQQGVDILDGGKVSRGIDKSANGVRVRGYDDGEDPVDVLVIDANLPWSPDVAIVHQVSSPMIEDAAFAAELITTYWLPEVEREVSTATVSTWRDDPFGPTQTFLIDALDRLGMGEPGWVLSNTLEVDEHGQLTQSVNLVAGGADPDAAAVPI